MEQITIAGHTFKAPLRYAEGHELTANEAGALNQTYHENLRNNFAGKVKAAAEQAGGTLSPDVLASLQSEFDTYAESYQFGIRTGGGAVRDPVMAEALRIAKDKIKAALKAQGRKTTDVTAEAITEAAKKLLASDKGQPIMDLARQRVQELQAAAQADLTDLVSDLPNKPAEPAPEASPQQ